MSGQLAITVLICLCVIPCLSIRQSDFMGIIMLSKLSECNLSAWHSTDNLEREKKNKSHYQSYLLV